MAKKTKEEEISEAVTKTMVPELQTASGINAPNEKKFSNDEATIHFELEKPAVGPGAEQQTGTSTPEISMPTATTAKVQPATKKAAPLAKLKMEHEPRSLSQAATARSGPVARVMNSSGPIEADSRGQPFWPVGLLLLACAGGYYYYTNPDAFKKKHAPVAGEAARDPASLVIAAQPDPVLNKDMAVKDTASDIKGLMVPVITNYGQDDMGIYVLKADSDDFRVLVNGKDMPVISGRISLPVHKKFDLRFVRRGYRDIKMVADVKKPETKEIVLKFVKGVEPKEE